ncbi:MAG: hypothetical protein LR005_02565, partial [Candidatus Pacebacteria bacterium]|nr:hypothetical protein [Candidatus Paceibacterota bacterium]
KTKTSPYESFMENYTVKESSKIRKGEGIYHALMRQTGNDKARVMALLKKHDYIKYDSAGKLIKDVRVKDGVGAAYDLVSINGKETIIESVNGNPCHSDEFDVVEVKKACDANDLTTGKLERQEYVHSYAERPRVAVRVPDEVAREYEYLPHQDEIPTHTIEKQDIINTEYIKPEPEIRYVNKYIKSEPEIRYVDKYIKSEPEIRYVDKYIERPAPQEKITPKVREMVKQGRTRELRKMEERGEIKTKKKKGRFWKWLGRLGTDLLANEISYQIHKGDRGQDIIVCEYPIEYPIQTDEHTNPIETDEQTDPIDGNHNPANGEDGNTGNTNEEVSDGRKGGRGRRTGNGESVPDDLDGKSQRNTNTRRTDSQRTGNGSRGRRTGNGKSVPDDLDERSQRTRNSGRARTQKELYEREISQLKKERVKRNINSRNSTSTRRTSTRSTRGTTSSSRSGTQRTTSTGKSGGVRGRSNRSGR